MVKNTAYKIPIKERLCVVGEKVLDECLKLQPLQRYVNRRTNNKYVSSFVNYHGNSEIYDVFSDYRFIYMSTEKCYQHHADSFWNCLINRVIRKNI